jgi:predicted HTH domain antitoxin
VQITLNIPDELAAHLLITGKEPARAVLETLALEGYRTEQLSEAEIKELLGFNTRLEVHAFLKERGAYLHYSREDLEEDRRTAQGARERSQRTAGEHRPG